MSGKTTTTTITTNPATTITSGGQPHHPGFGNGTIAVQIPMKDNGGWSGTVCKNFHQDCTKCALGAQKLTNDLQKIYKLITTSKHSVWARSAPIPQKANVCPLNGIISTTRKSFKTEQELLDCKYGTNSSETFSIHVKRNKVVEKEERHPRSGFSFVREGGIGPAEAPSRTNTRGPTGIRDRSQLTVIASVHVRGKEASDRGSFSVRKRSRLPVEYHKTVAKTQPSRLSMEGTNETKSNTNTAQTASSDAVKSTAGPNESLWGTYNGPWPYKCATQLPDEEVLPRLRRYLELGERRLPIFLKTIEELEPTDRLAIVAAINACASSIFNQCSVVRGHWERTYQPDLTTPNNIEKLRKFAKITKNLGHIRLLPHLEDLVAQGKKTEACELLKSIRRLAHVNKNTPRRLRTQKDTLDRTPPTKRNSVDDAPTPELKKVKTEVDPSELPSLKTLIPSLIHELAEESAAATPLKTDVTPAPAATPAPSAATAIASATHDDTPLMREIRLLHQELFVMKQRLHWYEHRYATDAAGMSVAPEFPHAMAVYPPRHMVAPHGSIMMPSSYRPEPVWERRPTIHLMTNPNNDN
ncbi:hypothetical protein PROFUN_09441 [Planoprotostelium fungivorum]|uniref:Uncharacterized protein n=1 Tax=Planoprotostelium fungivorum TaxID=1890364 RepID=A0A2P6NH12_9EUKA|nr:hypothetical protein PROFUN_09441 [Planoprotostelium fungivorum]